MSRRVLVVDDDPEARSLARGILERNGVHADEAEDVEGCLEALRSDSSDPDVILLDLTMPGGSGWIALNELRADANYEHIPVVIVTSHDDDQFREGAKKSGVKHYLTKPYKAWELIDVVERSRRPRRMTDPWAHGN